MTVAGWAGRLADLLLPAGCVACGRWIPGGSEAPMVCELCRTRLRKAPWPRCDRCHHPVGGGSVGAAAVDCGECRDWPEALAAARYAHVLEAPADHLVHALKYEGWGELAPVMGAAMARLPLPIGPGGNGRVVVPVPTTARRLRDRGYNQAELLATEVARALQLPLVRALRRCGDRGSQTRLSPLERKENVRGAFTAVTEIPHGEAGIPGGFEGRQVLLVDDVLTTGATASAAASALAAAGAASVCLVAFARALPTLPKRR